MVYNFTAIGQENNVVGASLSILTQVAAVGVIAAFSLGKRKKRDVGDTSEDIERAKLQHLIIQILFDLDEFGCSAGAVCEAVATEPELRNYQQILLLNSFGLPSHEEVLEWNRLSEAEGKYEYAAFIGRYSNIVKKPELCSKAFPKCPTPFSHVTRMLSSKTNCMPSNDFLTSGLSISAPNEKITPVIGRIGKP